jgi:membrane protein
LIETWDQQNVVAGYLFHFLYLTLHMLKKIKYFFEKEIWITDPEALPRHRSIFIKQLRIIVMTLRGFNEDKVQLRASALTFYSLLSIVPVIAMIFGIAKGFGMEGKLNELLVDKLGSHQDVMEQVIGFAHSLLNNTKGGLVAGFGVLLLFWSVLKVMGNIERSFNAIWGIKKDRTLIKKFTEYMAIIIIAPVLLIIASSVNIFVSSTVKSAAGGDGFLMESISGGMYILLEIVPYFLLWGVLTLLYMVMPNTKVSWKSALAAGIVAGTAFNLVEWAYVSFQIGVVQFNAIYGSFAALPLFLVWLQTSWVIVLFGAELSFANQNVEQYSLEEESKKISLVFRKKLTLLIAHYVIDKFCSEKKAPSIDEIKRELKLPFRLVSHIVEDLINAQIFSKISEEEYKTILYQPSVDPAKLSIHYILNAIEELGANDIPEPTGEVYDKISNQLSIFEFEGESTLLKNI